MKLRTVAILIATTALGTGVTYRVLHPSPLPPVDEEIALEQNTPPEPEKESSKASPDAAIAAESIPEPQPAVAVVPVEPVQPPHTAANNPHDAALYWERQAIHFNRQLDQLEQEQDPAQRMNLIRALAGYVRIDTLSTLDWAMGLEDPAERRAALEAINKNALSGIGARIETDETGFPVIRETTVLSAVAATGLVQPGDYIVGIEDRNGSTVFFDGMPIQQVVQHLRGQPGTAVNLIMERVPTDGSGEPYSFDVSIQRSLLVIQPPF